MNVKELIGNGLREIGVSTTGVENLSGDQFVSNFQQLQLTASALRLTYPWNDRQILTFNDLMSVDFVSIESMITSSDPDCRVPRLPVSPLSAQGWNDLVVSENVYGPSRYYWLQLPSNVHVYPQGTDWYYQVTGKVNLSTSLTPESDLTDLGIPDFFQFYLMMMFASHSVSYYKKTWSIENAKKLADAKKAVRTNTENTMTLTNADDTVVGYKYRVRYYGRHV